MTRYYQLTCLVDHTGVWVELRVYGDGLSAFGEHVHSGFDPDGDVASAIHSLRVNRAAARATRKAG